MPSISLNLHIIIIPNYKYLTLLGSSHRIASQLFCIFFSFTFFLRRDRVELVAPTHRGALSIFFFTFFMARTDKVIVRVLLVLLYFTRTCISWDFFKKMIHGVFSDDAMDGQLNFFFRSNRQLNFFLEYLHFLGTERRTSSKNLNMTRIIISLTHTHFRFEYPTDVSLNIQELK